MSKILTAKEFFESKSPVAKKAESFNKAISAVSEAKNRITKREAEKAKHSKHHSPYSMTSGEELDTLQETNPDLYSAIINWN